MSGPADFLRAFRRYLSSARLYAEGHASREESLEAAYRELEGLLEGEPRVEFSFLEDEVVFDETPVAEMKGWEWGDLMADVGIQRLEAAAGVTRDELARFLQEVHRHVEEEIHLEEGDSIETDHVRAGALGIVQSPMEEGEGLALADSVLLDEEAEAVDWVHDIAGEEGSIPIQEALTVVRSLSSVMRGARRLVVPLIRIKEFDEYTAAHCINVAVISMKLAEEVGHSTGRVKAIGAAALLHDVGKVRVPSEILNKSGGLTPDERDIVEKHPVFGTKILLDSDGDTGLMAAVAYEHHMGISRGGYPTPIYDRDPLEESRLVQVCDFYDALRTQRSYRDPLEPEKIHEIIQERRGTGLDPDYVDPFMELIERWDPAEVLQTTSPDGEEAPPERDREPEGAEAAAEGTEEEPGEVEIRPEFREPDQGEPPPGDDERQEGPQGPDEDG